MERAPEPSDVKWENCGASNFEKFKRRFLTTLGTLIILGICFGTIYAMNYAQVIFTFYIFF